VVLERVDTQNLLEYSFSDVRMLCAALKIGSASGREAFSGEM